LIRLAAAAMNGQLLFRRTLMTLPLQMARAVMMLKLLGGAE
jgi:hypothetical protein